MAGQQGQPQNGFGWPSSFLAVLGPVGSLTPDSMKFRHIGYNVDPYGQSFFLKSISAWNGLAQEIAAQPTLWIYLSLNNHIRLRADLSAIIFVKESC